MRLFKKEKMDKWFDWRQVFPGGKEREEKGRTSTERPAVFERMKALFEREKISYRLIPHSEVYTAPELAASIHVPGREVAKVVVVRADKKYAMAVLPANRPLDLVRFSQLLGVRHVSLATEGDMKKLFPDCEVGAAPPFGNFYGLEVYVEASLASEKEIFFPAGSHHEVVQMRY
ncbi:MAG TPA: YbaK/EbsC family protein, partial [Candidatus Manganitrophaceae bacterium]